MGLWIEVFWVWNNMESSMEVEWVNLKSWLRELKRAQGIALMNLRIALKGLFGEPSRARGIS